MSDPFAPSSDPDIPTPTREDLLPHVHGSVRAQLAAGRLDAKHAENEWLGARRMWDEGHKRDAERRREEEANQSQVKEIGLPLAGGALEEKLPGADSEFPGTFRDVKPLEGTRVPAQLSSETHRRIEEERFKAEVIATMHSTHRDKYDDPNTPEDQRNAIFEIYKDKLDERREREKAELRRELEKIAKAQDLLHQIKNDPSKAHLPRPADDSKEELLRWFDEMSKPVRNIPFPNPSPQEVRRDRMWRDIQATGRADPKDIAEEEAEALRYRFEVAKERERKRLELEAEFLRRPFPEDSLGEQLLEGTSQNVAEAQRLLRLSSQHQPEAGEIRQQNNGGREPVENKPKRATLIFQSINHHKVTAGLLFFFLSWTAPLSLMATWQTFVRDKTLPDWLAANGYPRVWKLAAIWLLISTAASTLFYGALVLLSYRIGKRTRSEGSKRES